MRIAADHRGAVISQPNRPDATVALPDRVLGDLLSEELRRLDPDEPYSDALEAATGVTGLSERSPVREYIWYDPADPEANGSKAPGDGVAKAAADKPTPVKATHHKAAETAAEKAASGKPADKAADKSVDKAADTAADKAASGKGKP